MKYVYTFTGILLILFGTHYFAYRKGREIGRYQIESELQQTAQAQVTATIQASKKIIDNQNIISNNDDECFNRVWNDKIIKSVNILR